MANPQINLDVKLGLYPILVRDSVATLQINPLTSHEIEAKISHLGSYISLKGYLVNYKGAFSHPVTHIGSICADLANKGLVKRTMKFCPFENRMAVAFYV